MPIALILNRVGHFQLSVDCNIINIQISDTGACAYIIAHACTSVSSLSPLPHLHCLPTDALLRCCPPQALHYILFVRVSYLPCYRLPHLHHALLICIEWRVCVCVCVYMCVCACVCHIVMLPIHIAIYCKCAQKLNVYGWNFYGKIILANFHS